MHPHEKPTFDLNQSENRSPPRFTYWLINVLWIQKPCQFQPNMRRQPHTGWGRLTLNKHRLTPPTFFILGFVSTHQLTCTAWKERFYPNNNKVGSLSSEVQKWNCCQGFWILFMWCLWVISTNKAVMKRITTAQVRKGRLHLQPTPSF